MNQSIIPGRTRGAAQSKALQAALVMPHSRGRLLWRALEDDGVETLKRSPMRNIRKISSCPPELAIMDRSSIDGVSRYLAIGSVGLDCARPQSRGTLSMAPR